jgi:Type IV secretion system pilin
MKIYKTVLSATATFFVVSLPVLVFAQASQTGLKNPLAFGSIQEFLEALFKATTKLALPIIVIMIVIAGFQFILAQGNPAKLQKAKMNFLYVIIGTGLILGAWLFASLIGSTISALKSS